MKTSGAIILLLLPAIVAGCHSSSDAIQEEGDVLVTVGDSVLYLSDVEHMIPGGLTPEDSAEMFGRIVDQWVETRVLEEVARENVVDLERINRLTENYRNHLIVNEYLHKIRGNAPSNVDKGAIEEYWHQYGDSMLLEQPLVKGVFLRTSENDSQLENIRKWIFSASESDIDELEKKGLKEATGYEYFADRWVEWGDLAPQIPLRITDADLFLKENRDYEAKHGGSAYFLHVIEYVPSGSVMPKEYAVSCISEILSERQTLNYKKGLIKSIYNQAVKDGILKKGSYDPMSRI